MARLYKEAARLGHGKGYHSRAADGPAPSKRHRDEGHWVAQQYLPDIHKDRRLYNPSDQGYEAGVRERVEKRRAGSSEE